MLQSYLDDLRKSALPSMSLVIPLFILIIAAFIYGQYGFHGTLVRDDAIYLYSGQRLADGIPPYVSVFDHKGPLAPLLSGFAVVISRLLGTDDIYTVRAVFFVLSCFTVVAIYLLASTIFSSTKAGILTALVFVGFWGFARHAASGPRAKTPMVLFEVLALLLTARRKWFWAAVSGSLAFLTWQPSAIFPLVTLILAWAQPESRRMRSKAALYAVAGALVPVVIVSLYFLLFGALDEAIDGAILFNIQYLERPTVSPLDRVMRPLNALLYGYPLMSLCIIAGLTVIPLISIMIGLRRTIWGIPTNNLFVPILLSFLAPYAWSLLDFQSYPDFFVLLPYAAIGFGWILHGAIRLMEGSEPTKDALQKSIFIGLCMILFAAAWFSIRFSRENGLDKQRQVAMQIESRYGRDVKLVSIGVPQLLVLLQRTNPNRYVFIDRGIDNHIHANTPGGFAGWLNQLEAYAPLLIAFGNTRGQHRAELVAWLDARYHPEEYEGWTLYVRN